MGGRPVLKIAVAGALVAALVSGCKSNAQSEVQSNYPTITSFAPPSTSTPAAAALDLNKVVLGVGDMPTGWTATNNAVAVSLGEAGCLKTASRRAATKQSRYVTFAGAGGAPIMSEALAVFPSATVVSNFEEGVKTLEKCKKVEITAGTVTFTGGVVTTSAPTVGEGSKTFTLTATGKGHVLTEYIILARQRTAVFMMTYAAVKTPVISDFLTTTAKAAAKIAG